MQMQKIRKYATVIFLLVITTFLLGMQLMAQFVYVDDVEQIITKRSDDVSELLASVVPTPTVKNEYFTMALPSGMSMFAIDKNNFKARYGQMFFEVHMFTSKINSKEYAKSKFQNMQMYQLSLEKNLFFYVKEIDDNVLQLSMYSDGIEVSVNTTKQSLENAILKSAELIHNTTLLETTNNSVFIGGNTDQSSQSSGKGIQTDEGTEENNKEIPIVKE